jgi:hypothetical protein
MIRRLSAESLTGWGMTYAGFQTGISDDLCQLNECELGFEEILQ